MAVFTAAEALEMALEIEKNGENRDLIEWFKGGQKN